MKNKIGIVIIGLIISSMLLTLVPKVSSETLKPDLTIYNIAVTHGPLDNYHTVWVTVKNIGTYAADPWWITRITLEVVSKTGMGSLRTLLEFNHTVGLPVGWSRLIIYTFYWDNPDPDNVTARCSAYTDFYHQVDEINENNNYGCTGWWS
jgi:hypothetical protein